MFGLVAGTASLAFGQNWSTVSEATGWDNNTNAPVTVTDSRSYGSVAGYTAAGRILQSDAAATTHSQTPTFSRARAYTILDQSDPANGTLRQLTESRAIYFSSVTHPVSSRTLMTTNYDLNIVNRSGWDVQVVLSNHIRGRMAAAYEGVVEMREATKLSIDGFVEADFAGSARVVNGSGTSDGGWAGAMSGDTYQDPYLGQIQAHRLNSFQVYTSVNMPALDAVTIKVEHEFELKSSLQAIGFQNGIAVGDFTGTADLRIRAFDNQGIDRTSEMEFTLVVPEPTSAFGIAFGLAALLGRRNRTR